MTGLSRLLSVRQMLVVELAIARPDLTPEEIDDLARIVIGMLSSW
jgi:hypothetical protein